jgi:hypothetical protein
MNHSTTIDWFRKPVDSPADGTLNACYNALDIHVVRGRADEVALALDGTERTFARLLTEVAACAGVLRAFGIGVGDRIVLGWVPPQTAVVVVLAAARVGALVAYDNSPGAEGRVQVAETEAGVAFLVDGEELPWDVAMRAGRTDPAPCADVAGDAVLAVHGDDVLTTLGALGVPDDQVPPVPPGASRVEVGGLGFWVFDAP